MKRRWSPLSSLPRAKLSEGTGLLDTWANEVEVLMREPLQLRMETPAPIYNQQNNDYTERYYDRDEGLELILTTHRIVWITTQFNKQQPEAYYLDLSLIQDISYTSNVFKSAKVLLDVMNMGVVKLVFGSSQMRDSVYSELEKCLSRRKWEFDNENVNKTNKNIRQAGVAAVIERNKRKNAQAKDLSKNAFVEYEGLLQKARDVVSVIEKYSATLERQQQHQTQNNSNSSSTTNSHTSSTMIQDQQKLSEMLSGMGMMTSAVTEKTAGSMYHKQLARQLAQFLNQQSNIIRQAGMITLTDVYCLFNRARGTNLISPQDLLKATDLLSELDLGLSKRKFSRGVVVIQLAEHDDHEMGGQLRELAKLHTSITASDASRILKYSVVLITEQLHAAEQLEYLCRDTTLEGTRFYPNMFAVGDF